ncbi:pyridine nucleotide-disulfide oxidoreductase [Rhodovarius crocodyli]|uniref:Pyridine nucleotide-disulfide oxidoreductase n=1 Tax=Rhodovarius crocodyli TaxID=1979269 RepID=A0A437MPK1_9PROT|nr:FAD-dependent oxidoreductase [Rhodovarius crocodyli]RVT99571.1 pyridine nucleotide-disulfide oxidoreductase [Rhodovarius crocodyli]
MPPRHVDFLLLGGGAAAASAAETLSLESTGKSILMLSAEDIPPYRRPMLSKQGLLGDAPALLHDDAWYRAQQIELALNTRAVSVDTDQHLVTTDAGETLHYDKLLIATGAQPRALGCPGERLPGVHHLRRWADREAVRDDIRAGAKHAVVLGGSFLGMEIAMTLNALGLSVTVVELGLLLLRHTESPEVSAEARRGAEEAGVTILLGDQVSEIRGEDRVTQVVTAAGRTLPCDILMVSVGVAPATVFLAGSGITLEKGLVVVDDQLRSSAADVFAAGDVTLFDDPVFARRRHIEHWDNAVKQGRLAARNMLGQGRRYDEVSYFYCDFGRFSFSMLGMPEGAAGQVRRGSWADASVALFYLEEGVPRALFSMGRPPEETRAAEGLIRYRVRLEDAAAKLADPAFVLNRVPTQTVLVLQGGGALGAFEAGVVKALEEREIFPDIVAGISIGALNGAIVAGNPRDATRALECFWEELSVQVPGWMPADAAGSWAAGQILSCGVPAFFRPRWMVDPLSPPAGWTSFYDTAPMRETLARYVDFSKLRQSPVRLLVGAVNVTNARFEVFDSYAQALTPDHILASGSLPPGFSWTEVNGQPYWDGGIVSNSPLDMVIDRCGPDGKRVFTVHLFAGERPLPRNMMEVQARRDEILYAERIRSDVRLKESTGAYRELVRSLLELAPPEMKSRVRQWPLYIQLMGDGAPMEITHFLREGREGEASSRDYDFSAPSVRFHLAQGYAEVGRALGR